MKQYIVGIDLGTSNTVVAYVEAGTEEISIFDIDQLVGLGEVGARELLPSVRYHPAPGELAPGDLQLPWSGANKHETQPAVIGHLARTLGAQVPGRLVTSAKSWLSHASVDRLAPILPWGADDEVGKVSPVTASASYLAHVRAAWNRRFPHALLEDQDVVLTVPASFDDGARALTLEAARIAKLPALRLLEEPQAAFYDWLFHHRATLGAELAQTRLVLVCDVGGGTTDLTLIKVHFEDGEPQLTRIGVGNHLMLGGDNMDLALAHLVEARFGHVPKRQWGARL
jgi:molecular chaperone DnaK (HSP70)